MQVELYESSDGEEEEMETGGEEGPDTREVYRLQSAWRNKAVITTCKPMTASLLRV
jgi:hypothetical protein